MSVKRNKVLIALLAGALAIAGTVSAVTLPDVFAKADTGDLDAVSLEVLRGDELVVRLLIRENEMGSLRLGAGARTLGIVPESISLRGDEVRLAFYELEHSRDANTKNGRWIEDLEISQGESIAAPSATVAWSGEPDLRVRLQGVRLASR